MQKKLSKCGLVLVGSIILLAEEPANNVLKKSRLILKSRKEKREAQELWDKKKE